MVSLQAGPPKASDLVYYIAEEHPETGVLSSFAGLG